MMSEDMKGRRLGTKSVYLRGQSIVECPLSWQCIDELEIQDGEHVALSKTTDVTLQKF